MEIEIDKIINANVFDLCQNPEVTNTKYKGESTRMNYVLIMSYY